MSAYPDPPSSMRVHYEEGECGSKLLPALAKVGSRQAPTFAFLDSFGGPDVPLALARAIARQPSSEVLVTFGTNFLTRFGTKGPHQESGDEVFGGPSWRQVAAISGQVRALAGACVGACPLWSRTDPDGV